MATVETIETERLVALVLGEAERDALVRVLYVARAAEWVEEHALDFIESGPAVVIGAVTAETAATRLAA